MHSRESMDICYTGVAMDVKSLQTLDLYKVLERMARFTAFSAARELALDLMPTADVELAIRRQQETTAARLLLDANPGWTIGAAFDVRPAVEASEREAILESNQLLNIKSTLIAGRTQLRFFEKEDSSYKVLQEIVAGIEPIPGLIDAISKTLDDRGNVLDQASPKLATIRRDIKLVRDRLASKLDRLVSDSSKVKYLQEALITQRDGRYVVPVRTEYKGKIKGIIHDRSASGATIFVEPLAVVELNNQNRELELAERDEVRRILAELSAQVAEHAASIIRTVATLAYLDLIYARAHYALEIQAVEPVLHAPAADPDSSHPGTRLRLIAARHPLLDPEQVVANDLILEPDVFALVLTGPNTGGKTVTLKTAGLLVLMAQCGLHIPATSGSEISVFSNVFADIGDEQSIEQSLSTFSGHVSNIVRILNKADERSLVLFDELGAGTDPQEGAALARAILMTCMEKRLTTFIATHYPELKVFAHATPGVRNASLEFDLQSLRPTYRLQIGLPGRSNALAIAERLGLNREVIERARAFMAPDDLRAEDLLDDIYRQREAARTASIAADEAHEVADQVRSKLERRLDAIEDERLQILAGVRAESKRELEQVYGEIARLRKKLAAAAQPLLVLEQIEKEHARVEETVSEPVQRTAPTVQKPSRPFKLGDKIYISTIATEGVITSLERDRAEVQVGRLRVRARLDELMFPLDAAIAPRPGKTKNKAQPVESASPKVSVDITPSLEIDLRGSIVEDALEELERHLDSAFLVGMPFMYVIHGKGTGRLRQAIRQWLKRNPYVASFAPGNEKEGGDGVTVIRLKEQ